MSTAVAISVRPREVGEVGHEMGGTDHSIPVLVIAADVEVILYDFLMEPALQSAWLADLSTHALELAALIDARAAQAVSA